MGVDVAPRTTSRPAASFRRSGRRSRWWRGLRRRLGRRGPGGPPGPGLAPAGAALGLADALLQLGDGLLGAAPLLGRGRLPLAHLLGEVLGARPALHLDELGGLPDQVVELAALLLERLAPARQVLLHAPAPFVALLRALVALPGHPPLRLLPGGGQALAQLLELAPAQVGFAQLRLQLLDALRHLQRVALRRLGAHLADQRGELPVRLLLAAAVLLAQRVAHRAPAFPAGAAIGPDEQSAPARPARRWRAGCGSR